jgi:TolA-binding protein
MPFLVKKIQRKASYYQADMNFKLYFQKAIELRKAIQTNAIEKSELNKIIESYFNLKETSSRFLLGSIQRKKGRWNTDYYQLGYAYYKQNDFENAISQFNKIINGKDFVAQNAYYHLGKVT